MKIIIMRDNKEEKNNLNEILQSIHNLENFFNVDPKFAKEIKDEPYWTGYNAACNRIVENISPVATHIECLLEKLK